MQLNPYNEIAEALRRKRTADYLRSRSVPYRGEATLDGPMGPQLNYPDIPVDSVIRAPDEDKGGHIFSAIGRGAKALFPDIGSAIDKHKSGYYERYPWAPGPIYDALPDILGLLEMPENAAMKTTPVVGSVLFKGREWLLPIITESIEAIAGKGPARKWLSKAKQDVPNSALKATREYYKALGRDVTPSTMAGELEGASILPERVDAPKAREVLDDYMPPGWIIDEDASVKKAPPYSYPYELHPGGDNPDLIQGLEGIEKFAQETGPQIFRPKRPAPSPLSNMPVFRGAVPGSGGHVNLSWEGMDPTSVRKFSREYYEREPLVFEPHPPYQLGYKDTPGKWEDRYVVPGLSEFAKGSSARRYRNLSPSNYEKAFVDPNATIETIGWAKDRKRPALNLESLTHRDPSLRRAELRGFASPEDEEGWLENFLLTQAILDRSRLRPDTPFPKTLPEWKEEAWSGIIQPNMQHLRSQGVYDSSLNRTLYPYPEHMLKEKAWEQAAAPSPTQTQPRTTMPPSPAQSPILSPQPRLSPEEIRNQAMLSPGVDISNTRMNGWRASGREQAAQYIRNQAMFDDFNRVVETLDDQVRAHMSRGMHGQAIIDATTRDELQRHLDSLTPQRGAGAIPPPPTQPRGPDLPYSEYSGDPDIVNDLTSWPTDHLDLELGQYQQGLDHAIRTGNNADAARYQARVNELTNELNHRRRRRNLAAIRADRAAEAEMRRAAGAISPPPSQDISNVPPVVSDILEAGEGALDNINLFDDRQLMQHTGDLAEYLYNVSRVRPTTEQDDLVRRVYDALESEARGRQFPGYRLSDDYQLEPTLELNPF